MSTHDYSRDQRARSTGSRPVALGRAAAGHPLLALQRMAGNAAVARLVELSQPVLVQRQFVWDEVEGQEAPDVRDHDEKADKGFTVYRAGGDFGNKFISYAHEEMTTKYNVKPGDVRAELVAAHNADASVSLGNRADYKDLADALVAWLDRRFADQPDKLKDETSQTESEPEKIRKKYYQPQVKGVATGVPGRLLIRSYSVAEGMRHTPHFAFSGYGVSAMTPVNDNATYSIGIYQIRSQQIPGQEREHHFLGGSISGEKFGEEKGTAEQLHMHAEEQQLESLDRQILLNSHGVGDAASTGTVILHLHISKSPCSDRCQAKIGEYLEKYPGLQIQMYLEIPYLSNRPEDMILEAKKLGALMEKVPGRLAYRVVSVHKAKAMLDDFHESLRSSLGALIVENLAENEANPERAKKRMGKFAELVENQHLPPSGWVAALSQ